MIVEHRPESGKAEALALAAAEVLMRARGATERFRRAAHQATTNAMFSARHRLALAFWAMERARLGIQLMGKKLQQSFAKLLRAR